MTPSLHSIDNAPELFIPLRVPFGSTFPENIQVPENIYVDDFILHPADNLSRDFFLRTQVHYYLSREEYLKDSCPFPKVSKKRNRSAFENYIDFEVRTNPLNRTRY